MGDEFGVVGNLLKVRNHVLGRYTLFEFCSLVRVNSDNIKKIVATDVFPMGMGIDHNDWTGCDFLHYPLDVTSPQTGIDQQGPIFSLDQIGVGAR